MLGKDKRLVLGMILFRPTILSVTQTLERIGTNLTRSFSQLFGVNLCRITYVLMYFVEGILRDSL